jgi:hypothetical protein
MRLSFIQLAGFRANWNRLKMTDDDLRDLEAAILAGPSRPPIMRGTGGLRKIRFASERASAGKSGGARVCYAYFAQFDLVYLCAVFLKNEKSNLSHKEKNAYRQLLTEFERYLDLYSRKGWTP